MFLASLLWVASHALAFAYMLIKLIQSCLYRHTVHENDFSCIKKNMRLAIIKAHCKEQPIGLKNLVINTSLPLFNSCKYNSLEKRMERQN
jgi:hypothetical protein